MQHRYLSGCNGADIRQRQERFSFKRTRHFCPATQVTLVHGASPLYIGLAPCTRLCSRDLSKCLLQRSFAYRSFFCTFVTRKRELLRFQQSVRMVVKSRSKNCYIFATLPIDWIRQTSVIQQDKGLQYTSLSLRNKGCKSADYAIYTLFHTQKYLQPIRR